MTDLRDHLTASLGSRYTIERELGGGGMSRVFLVHELELERRVVVKVLPPDVTVDLNAERFRREIQLAARLQHPHIVPLLAAGTKEGLLYYTMPFIAGESLRARLAQKTQLPVPEVVRLLRDVADALAYAHGNGVVHRDIKPDNVLVSGGHGMVTDFGVAKAVSHATGDAGLTSIGIALGTPAYMAPEQAAAEVDVDHRADLYAFGAMAYELLTGRPPFVGGNAQQVIAAHMSQAVDPISKHRDDVPEALSRIIMRCLAKQPSDRFATADVLLADLDKLGPWSGGVAPVKPRPRRRSTIIVGTIVTVATLAGLFLLARRGPMSAATHTIAVIPLAAAGGDTSKDLLPDAITDDVTSEVAQLQVAGLSVINRGSADEFRGRSINARDVGARLRVDHIVELRVRRDGARVHVNADIVNTSNNAIAWTHAYDSDESHMHELSPAIAAGVIEALNVRPGHAASRSRHVPRPEAQYAFLRAFSIARRIETKADLDRAEAGFAEAARIDPEYAEPLAAAAVASSIAAGLDGIPPSQAYPLADSLARRALAIDPNNADAHAMLGWCAAVLHWDWATTKRETDTALVLDPNSLTAHIMKAQFLGANGHLREASQEAERALQLDPAFGPTYLFASALMMGRNLPDSAMMILRRLGEVVPQFTFAGWFYTDALRQKGFADSALKLDAQVSAMSGHPTSGYVASLAALGRHDEALAAYRQLVAAGRHQFVSPEEMARAAMSIGDRDAAIAWLRKAVAMHSDLVLASGLFLELEPLRSDPRFRELMKQVGLN